MLKRTETFLVLTACGIVCMWFGSANAAKKTFDNRTLTINEVTINDDKYQRVHQREVSINDLHEQGVGAYLDNNWKLCVKYFTAAVNEYRTLVRTTVKCRTRCKTQSDMEHLFPIDVENLYFYETAIRTTHCLLKCKNSMSKRKYISISPELEKLYKGKKPYEYLHLCHYQMKDFQKAASAAFTALIANPENDVMINNFKYYNSLPEVDSSQVENMEAKEFVPLYIQGVDAYENGDFSAATRLMEESLQKWLMAAEECRAYCESPFDQGWLPDFISSIANHFTYCLRCKQKCEPSLNSLNGEEYDDVLPSHYHYLQFSYYKVSNLQKACEAVESYLLFFPNDKTMLDNKQFYLKYLEGDSLFFYPREEALKYVRRQQYENKLLKFIEDEFKKFHEGMRTD